MNHLEIKNKHYEFFGRKHFSPTSKESVVKVDTHGHNVNDTMFAIIIMKKPVPVDWVV